MDSAQRIVITGMGVVSPVGTGVEAFHHALAEGRDGVSTVDFAWETGYRTNRAGQVKDFDLRDFAPRAPQMGRASQLAVAACKLALDDSGLDHPTPPTQRVGLVVGSALGDQDEFEAQWKDLHDAENGADDGDFRSWMRFGNLSSRVAGVFGFDGPSHVVATTCAAGNHAIAWAGSLLRSNAADAMIAIGADVVGFVDILGFSRLLLQAPDRCRPFDLRRKGTILSEGGAALVLETLKGAKRRRANILAEIAGYGLSCDAAGAFASDVTDIRGLQLAAVRAMRDARVAPVDIQHVSAHGSGTKLNDFKETVFLKKVLGAHAYRIPISAIKSMLGHAQGAASLFEAIACVLTLNRGIVYPTTNYETPDPNCDLDYVPNQAREQQVDTVLSNAFGVGGNNAVVIFRRWQE